MNMVLRYRYIFMLFLFLINVQGIAYAANSNACRFDNGRKLNAHSVISSAGVQNYSEDSTERMSILQPAWIIKVMNIKPDMSIVDIGAGSGLFTFEFAKALHGTGMVYATDILDSKVQFINDKAGEQGYRNIRAVKVNPDGVDPFYLKHSFDKIFLSCVYDSLYCPEAYLRNIMPSLDKKKGRLYIILETQDPDFDKVELEDGNRVVEILTTLGPDFPVYRYLSDEIKSYIMSKPHGGMPDEMLQKLTQAFTGLLMHRFLLNELSDYYAQNAQAEFGRSVILSGIIGAADAELAKWLMACLDQRNVFRDASVSLTFFDRRDLRKLNRILLRNIFRDCIRPEIPLLRIPVEKDRIISTLKAAGYRLVKDHDFLTHYYFLEFKRSR